MPALTRAQRQRYDVLYQSCLIRPARRAAVDQAAHRIAANRRRYQRVGKALGVPWYVVGIVHSLEAGCDFTRHLNNGDPLTARTPLLVSHGDDSGPKKLRFSAEDAYQRRHGHGAPVWLTVF